MFQVLGYDRDNFNTSEWNPLKDIVKPGNNVLIKPNLVMDYNFNSDGGIDCLFTHPSVVAAVVDYVIIALKGKGKIVIGDAPMQECNFKNLMSLNGYAELISFYKSKGIDIEMVDYRELKSTVVDGVHHAVINQQSNGIIVNLGEHSEFYGCDSKESKKFRITNYDPRILPTHHHDKVQEYYVSNYVLNADVIINMPKPKSHRKAGVTIALKNFVGINTRKEYLPHHTLGTVKHGGDEYLNGNIIHGFRSILWDRRNIVQSEEKFKLAVCYTKASNVISRILNKMGTPYSEGSWYGNHTISRTITDLNKIVKYADKNGIIHKSQQRKIFIIADMIVSGEKEGPVAPTPKEVGIIAAGEDPVIFDMAIATIMGFDINKIPTINCVQNCKSLYSSENIPVIVSNRENFNNKSINELDYTDLIVFEPSFGWKGFIEREK